MSCDTLRSSRRNPRTPLSRERRDFRECKHVRLFFLQLIHAGSVARRATSFTAVFYGRLYERRMRQRATRVHPFELSYQANKSVS